jgi:hypothetical protein
MSICILADAADIDRAKQIDLEYMSVDDLKKCVAEIHAFQPLLTGRWSQAEQKQETGQEACEEVRRILGLRGTHQADPASPWSWSFQGHVPSFLCVPFVDY